MDILFTDVTWMDIPVWFDGLHVTIAKISDLPHRLPTNIQREVNFRHIYRLTTDDVDHFILAGSIFYSEDDLSYMEPSPLLSSIHITNTF